MKKKQQIYFWFICASLYISLGVTPTISVFAHASSQPCMVLAHHLCCSPTAPSLDNTLFHNLPKGSNSFSTTSFNKTTEESGAVVAVWTKVQTCSLSILSPASVVNIDWDACLFSTPTYLLISVCCWCTEQSFFSYHYFTSTGHFSGFLKK